MFDGKVYRLSADQIERNRAELDRQLEAGEILFDRASALHAALSSVRLVAAGAERGDDEVTRSGIAFAPFLQRSLAENEARQVTGDRRAVPDEVFRARLVRDVGGRLQRAGNPEFAGRIVSKAVGDLDAAVTRKMAGSGDRVSAIIGIFDDLTAQIERHRPAAYRPASATPSTHRRISMSVDLLAAHPAHDLAPALVALDPTGAAPEVPADGPIDLDRQYHPDLVQMIAANDAARAAGQAHETDEDLGQRLEDGLRSHLKRAGIDPGLAGDVVDRAFMKVEPLPPADWLAILRDRLANPIEGDDDESRAALRLMLADAQREAEPPPSPRPPGMFPADIALPVAALLRAVARRIEARVYPC